MRLSIPLPRTLAIALLVLLALGSVVGRVEASSEGMRGDRCEVAQAQVIPDDFYFFCRILDVKGTIGGDLVGVASSVILHPSASVAGSVWIGGGKLVIQGRVGGDVRFGGVSLMIDPAARFVGTSAPNAPAVDAVTLAQRMDIVAVALNMLVLPEAVFPGNVVFYGYQAQYDGTLGGNLNFVGETLILNGVIAGHVDANVGDPRRNTEVPSLPFYDVTFSDPGLVVSEAAYIAGDLRYRAARPMLVPPETVNGRLIFEQTGGQPDITKVEKPDDAAQILRDYSVASLRDILSLLILGAIGLRVVPDAIRQPAAHVRRRTVPTIGWGLLTFMLSIPIVITVVMIGLIFLLVLYLIKLNELTIMIGAAVVIVTGVLVGSISFLLFFMGRLVVSFMVGQLLSTYALRRLEARSFRRWMLTLALGATAYALIINMPLPGLSLVIEMVTALAGVGAVMMYVRRVLIDVALLRPRLEPAWAPPPVMLPAPAPPPLIVPGDDGPYGLENLPPGFTGFDEDW